MGAARRGHVPMIRLLLEYNADVRLRDDEDRNASAWARLTGNARAARVLEHSAGSSSSDSEALAADVSSEAALINAAWEGDTVLFRQLLRKGVPISSQDEWHGTVLHAASSSGHEAVVYDILTDAAGKALVDALDMWKQTPLQLASQRGHNAIAKLLLKAKARIDEDDLDQRTALHWAVLAGSKKLVSLLLRRRADVSKVDRWGRNVVHLGAANGKQSVLELVLEALGRGGMHLRAGFSDTMGQAPLHLAAAGGHSAVVKLLTAAGANADATDGIGRAPAHYAAIAGHTEAISALLDSRASPHSKDLDERTVISFAADLS